MSYRIGSFNMKNFGNHPKREFEIIAKIIKNENLDVVALQEVLSEGRGVQLLLEKCVKYELRDWVYCWACPKETSDCCKLEETIKGDRRGEGYAYIWNSKKFKLAEVKKHNQVRTFEPRVINSTEHEVKLEKFSFSRMPYYIRLEPINGGFFELRLINIHIYFGKDELNEIQKRKQEHEILVKKVYPAISQERYGNNRPAYTIAMGDYNLNIFRAERPTQSKNAVLSEVYTYSHLFKPYRVITTQDALTTLKKCKNDRRERDQFNVYANNFDHFSYSPELSKLSDVRCWAVDAVQKYCNGDLERYYSGVSDHLPIVMEIKI